MGTHLICYDLDKPGQDYSDLISDLKKMGAKKIQFSTWLLETVMTDKAIRDRLRQFVDTNDRLLVCGLNGVAAWQNLMLSGETVKQILAA
jgi:CRISPR-associated endonuclease Cas2